MTLALARAARTEDDAPLPGVIGAHPLMRELYRLVRRAAVTDLPVLLCGETGTGKELVARAVHELSGRRGAMVAVNVCAIAETMVEDTLFGHVRGAFTGADREIPGYLLEADGGTLFLDEVGSLSLAVQVKLLRAIETRQFRPVGARADRQSRFRVVAATNADLRRLAEAGAFRRDLLERLHGVFVSMPPLRERRSDIPALAEHFASTICGLPGAITTCALTELGSYDWPGNVRELRMVIQRAVLLKNDHVIDRTAARSALGWNGGSGAPAEDRRPAGLVQALRAHDGDTAAAARALGIGRSTLYARLKQSGLDTPRRKRF